MFYIFLFVQAVTPTTSARTTYQDLASKSADHYKTSTVVLSVMTCLLLLLLILGVIFVNRHKCRTLLASRSNDSIQDKPICDLEDNVEM